MRAQHVYWVFTAFLLMSCASKQPGGPTGYPAASLNPDDCRNKGEDGQPLKPCALGFGCDEVSGLCTNQSCTNPADCKYPDGVQCINGSCSGTCLDNQLRYVDTYCLAWNSQRPMIPTRKYCRPVNTSTQPPALVATCNECWPDSMATADLSAIGCNDPLKPACALQKYPKPEAPGTFYYSYTCSPCTQDSECPSGICRKPGDYPMASPVPGLQTGQCVPTDNIAYVNNSGTPTCAMTNPGTQAAPVCTVAQAMAIPNKQYINVVGSGTTYGVLTVSRGSFVVVGAGRDRTSPNATMFDQVIVNGGASLVISGMQIKSPPATIPVQCNSTGSPSSLYLLDSTVEAPAVTRGIDGTAGCGQLNVERCRVTSGRFAISIVNPGAKYRIVNTAVSHIGQGGQGGEPYGVFIGPNTSGYFGFNTVTRYLAGVSCANNQQAVEDSIVAGNLNSQVDGCDTTNHVYQSATPLWTTGTLEPKLVSNSTFMGCCIDKGDVPSGSESVPTDHYGTARPQGQTYDIGYHELQ